MKSLPKDKAGRSFRSRPHNLKDCRQRDADFPRPTKRRRSAEVITDPISEAGRVIDGWKPGYPFARYRWSHRSSRAKLCKCSAPKIFNPGLPWLPAKPQALAPCPGFETRFRRCRSRGCPPQETLLVKACIPQHFSKELRLCFRRTGARNHIGVRLIRRLPQDLREDLIPALPAELRMEHGILHLQFALDLKWQGVHVCIPERVTQPFAVAQQNFDLHTFPLSVNNLGFSCSDKCAHELAVHQRSDRVHVNALVGSGTHARPRRIGPRRFDLDGVESGIPELRSVFRVLQRAGDAAYPQENVLAHLGRNIAVYHYVRHREASARL